MFFDYFYQCWNPADILFAILHFLSINNYKFKKCKHCGKYFATNNFKIEYCKNKSGYPNYEKYECGEAVKRIRQQIRRQSELINKNLRTNYLGDDLEKFITGRDILLDKLIKHSDYIVTKKQTIVEMDIPAKPCTPVMEIWMWRSQGIVTVITNHS